jgi:alpha-beta hydrolase superfamily lysophospholipase
MIDPVFSTQTTDDGYALHLTRWPTEGRPKGRVVVLHGVQSHGGWYHNLGRVLAGRGYETTFPDRRGSGKNEVDRGHAASSTRLLADVVELLRSMRDADPSMPIALAGISWGGKLAVITAARRPELVDALALICPGLHPRVDVGRSERLKIALAFFTNRHKRFPIPLADPALFTDSPDGQAFIASDPLSLRTATAALLAASRFIDSGVRKARGQVRQPSLLMLAGHDRIVDNARTRAYFEGVGSTRPRTIAYPDGHHTLEFDPDPSRYALDLAGWLDDALPAERFA